MVRGLGLAALIGLAFLPAEQPTANAVRFVAVPATDGQDCVDLDSRWGVGTVLAWRQTICGSREEPVWVQTDCAQDFGGRIFWMATSEDGRNFNRKTIYDPGQSGSVIAKFVCLSVGR
jgi:hypothetical protein